MKTPVVTIVAVLLACLTCGPSRAIDWSGVELAWQNDPRPVADAPVPVEVPPSRRTSRRAQRRIIRRGDTDAVTVEPQPTTPPPVIEVVEEPRLGDPSVAVEYQPLRDAALPRAVVHADQAYGEHPRQRYDLYLPEGCSGGGLPLVMWIQGRDWRAGSNADCPVTWLVDQGFAVASVDYRPNDTAVFPAQLDDCLISRPSSPSQHPVRSRFVKRRPTATTRQLMSRRSRCSTHRRTYRPSAATTIAQAPQQAGSWAGHYPSFARRPSGRARWCMSQPRLLPR